MTLELELQPLTAHERRLVFSWDSDEGTFTGPDGDTVRELCETYARLQVVITDPYPTSYPCTDPFHDPAHLAAVISTRWQLPPELVGYLSAPGPEGEVEVVY